MGKFVYEQTVEVEFDDRLLVHLQIVIGIKLRRGEPFYFSWKDDRRIGDGRTTVWIHPAIALLYKYYGSREPRINPAWVHALEVTANSNSGLHIVPEPEPNGNGAA